MPRLGGAGKQSYLVSGGGGGGGRTLTQTVLPLVSRSDQSRTETGTFTTSPSTTSPLLTRRSSMSSSTPSPPGSLTITPRSRSDGYILPDWKAVDVAETTTNATPLRRLNASESGSGSLLPDWSSSNSSSSVGAQPQRLRTVSTPLLRPVDAVPSTPAVPSATNISTMEGGLSLRRRALKFFDDGDGLPPKRQTSLSPTSFSNFPASSLRHNSNHTSHAATTNTTSSCVPGVKLSHLVQTLVIMVIALLVLDSRYKVRQASEQLAIYHKEEDRMMAQMDRIESRAMELQATLARLRNKDDDPQQAPVTSATLDTASVQIETVRWQQQQNRVETEIINLQQRLQRSARTQIAQLYGENNLLHITMDLDLPESSGQITFELFDDEAPHAVWVWLQQIQNHDWDNARFTWHPSHLMLASAARLPTETLEFIEEPAKSSHNHPVWSVGLTKREDGRVNMYINLQDNAGHHDGDPCVGKLVGGFDALQRLLRIPPMAEHHRLDPPVTIRSTTVTAIPKQQQQPSRTR